MKKVAVVFHSGYGHTPVLPLGERDTAKLLGQRVADVASKFRG